MSLLPRRLVGLTRHTPSDRDLLVAAGVVAVVAVVAGAVLGTTGLTLVASLVGLVLALVALAVPTVALLLVIGATFLRTAQKEFLPADAVIPVVAVMVVSVAAALALRLVPRPRVGAVEWLMLTYLGWNLLSTALPHEYEALVPITGASIDLERWFLAAILLPFAVFQVARLVLVSERALRWLLWTVVAMTACSTWLSIAQFHAPALTWPSYVVDAPNWPGRANGIFNQPVVNGVVLVLGIVVCLFLASRAGTTRNGRIGLHVLVAATTYAVYLTHTRAAVLGLAAAVVLGAVLARGWRTGFLAIGGLGALGLASQAATLFSPDRSEGGFGSPSEVHDRLNAAATALHAIADHPVIGIGVGRFGMYNTYEHQAWSDAIDWARGQVIIAHENDLGIGAEVGLPGLALWLAILATIGVLSWRARRALPGDGIGGGALGVVGLLALAVMVVNGFTVDLRPLEFTTVLPFVLLGAVVGRYERHRDTPVDETVAATEDAPGDPGPGDRRDSRHADPAPDDTDTTVFAAVGRPTDADRPEETVGNRTNGHHPVGTTR